MRNVGVEIYRVSLMFGICVLHSITQGPYNSPLGARLLLWCVTGFVFISGWFGIRFSVRKVFSLYGIAVFCGVAYCAASCILGARMGFRTVLITSWGIVLESWFLNSYVVLMMFSPILNLAAERAGELYAVGELKRVQCLVAPLLICVFAWSFLSDLTSIVPTASGLVSYSPMMMIGVYLAARLIRVCKIEVKVKSRILLCGIIVYMAMLTVGFHQYNSPVVFMMAWWMMQIFYRIKFPGWACKIATSMAPSMFSVYLLHSHAGARSYINTFELNLSNAICSNRYFVWLVTAVCIFLGCFFLDVPRRLFLNVIRTRRAQS